MSFCAGSYKCFAIDRHICGVSRSPASASPIIWLSWFQRPRTYSFRQPPSDDRLHSENSGDRRRRPLRIFQLPHEAGSHARDGTKDLKICVFGQLACHMAVRQPTAWVLRRIGPPASIPEVADLAILKEGATVFGRSTGADIYLDSKYLRNFISRRHAVVMGEVGEDGQLIFVLYNSGLNGTYINDVRMGDKQQLQEGDRVIFGHKNGYKVKVGEKALQPDSEFQFILERVINSTRSSPTNISQIDNDFEVANVNPSKNHFLWHKKDHCTSFQGSKNFRSVNGRPKSYDGDELGSVHTNCVDEVVSQSSPWSSTESFSAKVLQDSGGRSAENCKLLYHKIGDDDCGGLYRRRKNSDNSVTRSPPHCEHKRSTSPTMSDTNNQSHRLNSDETVSSRPRHAGRSKAHHSRTGKILHCPSSFNSDKHNTKLPRTQLNGFESASMGDNKLDSNSRSPSPSQLVKRKSGSPGPRHRIAKQPEMDMKGQQSQRPSSSLTGYEETHAGSPESVARTPSPSFMTKEEYEEEEEEEEMEIDEESVTWEVPPTPGRGLVETGELLASPQTSPCRTKQKITPGHGLVQSELDHNPQTSPQRVKQNTTPGCCPVETDEPGPSCKTSSHTLNQKATSEHSLSETRDLHLNPQTSPRRTKRKLSPGPMQQSLKVSMPFAIRTPAMKKVVKDVYREGNKDTSELETRERISSSGFSENHLDDSEGFAQSQKETGLEVGQRSQVALGKLDRHGVRMMSSDSSDDDVFHRSRSPDTRLASQKTGKIIATESERETSHQSMGRGRTRYKPAVPKLLREKENGRQQRLPLTNNTGLKMAAKCMGSADIGKGHNSAGESILKDVWVAVERVTADNIAKHSRASSSSSRPAKNSAFTDKTKSKDIIRPAVMDDKKQPSHTEKPNPVRKEKQSLFEEKLASAKDKPRQGFTLDNFLFPPEDEKRKLPKVRQMFLSKKLNRSDSTQEKRSDKEGNSGGEKDLYKREKTMQKRQGHRERSHDDAEDKSMVTRDSERRRDRKDIVMTRGRDRSGDRKDTVMTRGGRDTSQDGKDTIVTRGRDASRDRKDTIMTRGRDTYRNGKDAVMTRGRVTSRDGSEIEEEEETDQEVGKKDWDDEPSHEKISSRPVRKTAVRRPRIMMDRDQQQEMLNDSDDEVDNVPRRRERRKRRRKRRGDGDDDDDEDESLEDGVVWYEEESCESDLCTRPSQRRVEWVQCDDCDKWYHTVCVGCNYESIKDEEFHCGCQ